MVTVFVRIGHRKLVLFVEDDSELRDVIIGDNGDGKSEVEA